MKPRSAADDYAWLRLRSSILEIPIIIISGLVLPLFVLRQQGGRRSWLLVLLSPVVALVITVGYFSVLHSSFFPDRLLDQSARDWKTIASRSK